MWSFEDLQSIYFQKSDFTKYGKRVLDKMYLFIYSSTSIRFQFDLYEEMLFFKIFVFVYSYIPILQNKKKKKKCLQMATNICLKKIFVGLDLIYFKFLAAISSIIYLSMKLMYKVLLIDKK